MCRLIRVLVSICSSPVRLPRRAVGLCTIVDQCRHRDHDNDHRYHHLDNRRACEFADHVRYDDQLRQQQCPELEPGDDALRYPDRR